MSDIIRLLPDSLANQIAAGEVVQRPASVVKELLENAIDAGATQIKLIIKDAGKALIQVIDNGKGMSETDARMCFERHATSKIKDIEDLFRLHTFGFRGEALASIAAVANVSLKTRQTFEDTGTHIEIEGSVVRQQDRCQTPMGTSMTVRNLFYNVPARRQFLKSTTIENRHIIDEFQHVALANPQIHFSYFSNDTEIYHLPISNLRKRIVGLWGNVYNEKLIPVEEKSMELVQIMGYVGKPDSARKTKGEQFFFVNNRFIRSSYLNHAVVSAYEEMLGTKTYPLYVLFLTINPERIDVNVHPTKQEIKFEDEKAVYALVNAAVKRALGVNNIVPSLDFEQEATFNFNVPKKMPISLAPITPPTGNIKLANNINETDQRQGNFGKSFERPSTTSTRGWQDLYKIMAEHEVDLPAEDISPIDLRETIILPSVVNVEMSSAVEGQLTLGHESQIVPYQLHRQYIVSPIKSGFLLIDQQAASERILFEKYAQKQQVVQSQRLLFPRNITLPSGDALLLREILADINALGYDLQEFGTNSFVLHGLPADLLGKDNEQLVIEALIEQYKVNQQDLKLDSRAALLRSLARQSAIQRGQYLSVEEMNALIDQLFGCENPNMSLSGRVIFVHYEMSDLERLFGR